METWQPWHLFGVRFGLIETRILCRALSQPTWLSMYGGTTGELNGKNGIGVSVTDAITSPVEGANVIGC